MPLRFPRTLITGKPGVGKTTVIQKVIALLPQVPAAGFHTAEMRCRGYRSGFELRALNGTRRVLAKVGLRSRHRVGKYGVDTAGFEAFLAGLDLLSPHVGLVVIDEIGKMELFSSRFRSLVEDLLSSDKGLLASIAWKGDDFIQAIKQRPDVQLMTVTPRNRDRLPAAIVKIFGQP